MKFTLVKDLRHDPLMRPLLGGLLLFVILFLGADIAVKQAQFGLTPAQLETTLYGDEARYVEPLTQHFLLEHLHADIFFIMMVLLTLSAVYARLCRHKNLRLVMINAVMMAALSATAFLPLAYFVSDLFVLPYIVAFFAWHLGAFWLALASLYYLFAPLRKG